MATDVKRSFDRCLEGQKIKRFTQAKRLVTKELTVAEGDLVVARKGLSQGLRGDDFFGRTCVRLREVQVDAQARGACVPRDALEELPGGLRRQTRLPRHQDLGQILD